MKTGMRNKFIGIFLILLWGFAPLHAEKASWIKNIKATASWDVTGNTSLNEAKENALFEAKKSALRQAGMGTNVQSMTFSSMAQGNENFSDELFSQINAFYISGRVKMREEPEYEQTVENGIIRVRVSILADVLKEAPVNPEFQISVKGFEKSYKVGTPIRFSVKSSKDCYVRVFWFDNTTTGSGFMLYPLSGYDRDEPLQQGREYVFPRSQDFDYTTTLNDGKELETTFIFVVATRQQIPYLEQEVSFEKFFKWYYTIDSQEKTNYHPFGFNVFK
ncbi:MAG: DUF4384 domain-containing protein [Bacteroides sp.]|nr:DUF4384 domain-containing protein [Bacteroides sp.]MCM1085478.1 DUF4384 domain-containing protein [Bacteroides sp.]